MAGVREDLRRLALVAQRRRMNSRTIQDRPEQHTASAQTGSRRGSSSGLATWMNAFIRLLHPSMLGGSAGRVYPVPFRTAQYSTRLLHRWRRHEDSVGEATEGCRARS